jgi:two-component system response regulator VicR
MKQKILVVDDEAAICDLLKISLQAEGYDIAVSNDGRDALLKLASWKPDLLILDLMLPGLNGFDICKKVTAENPIPIIMLTAKADLVDKVIGLELGADDYVTKPFHVRELTARVKALLRRVGAEARTVTPKKLKNGRLELYPERHLATLEGSELELSVKEYELLYFFMSNINRVFTRSALLERVWGYDYPGDTRTVDVHIQRLRSKLKGGAPDSSYIHTVFGVGYKMPVFAESEE